MNQNPRVLAISGLKNTGKTRLIKSILPLLADRGLRIAVIKHDGHRFEADRPGTDSYQYLEAGAFGTAVFDGEKYQFVKKDTVDEAALIGQFPEADLILLEGFKLSHWPKLELLRRGVSESPVCHASTRLAFVTDKEAPEPGFPVFSPDELTALADFLQDFSCCGKDFSSILLAGGRSSRMGVSKSELPFGGKRMIDHQIERLSMLGIDDIVIAGFTGAVSEGRSVPDELPGRGPLGGLTSALAAAAHDKCLVLSVDAPLVPLSVLFTLMREHRNGITVVEHGGQTEPLIGVYDRALCSACRKQLDEGRGSVRRLFETVPFSSMHCATEAILLSNCNTPEEYRRMAALWF